MNRPYTTNKYQDEVVDAIIDSTSFAEAVKHFDGACMLCAIGNRPTDCAKCPIRRAILYGEKSYPMSTADQEWIRREREDG